MSPSDHDLLIAWRDGDRRAGDQLVTRHYKSIYRFFANKLRDTEEVEELAQRTFTAATDGLERFSGDSSARTWLYGIARNLLRQWFEGRRRARAREDEFGEGSLADVGPGPNTILELASRQRMLVAALRRISLDSQLILELRYWEGLKLRQLAEVFACPESTVSSRIRKAKAELRGALDEVARSPEELDSTMDGLETWAKQLRDAWLAAS